MLQPLSKILSTAMSVRQKNVKSQRSHNLTVQVNASKCFIKHLLPLFCGFLAKTKTANGQQIGADQVYFNGQISCKQKK